MRTPFRAKEVDPRAVTVVGDLTDATTLTDAVEGIDAVIFTHGDNAHAEAVNYGAVRNVLQALNGRPVRVALMTTNGVTVRHPSSEWKRRGERLVRASGNRYTIIRPGWFDYNDANERKILLLQGDTRRSGSTADGATARDQLARVLLAALTDPAAESRTFELFDERGPEQDDISPLFAALDPDPAGSVDGVLDQENLPLEQESAPVRADLDRVRTTC